MEMTIVIGINVTRQNKNTPVRPYNGRTGVFLCLSINVSTYHNFFEISNDS